MSDKSYECKSLQWDTDYFGVSSARVNLSGIIDEKGQDDIIKFCEEYEFITLSNFDNLKENNRWIGNKTNAFLTDMNIQFLKELRIKPDNENGNTFVMNCLSRNEQIVDIAKKSFNYSRFFNDSNLPEEQAKNIYLRWTEGAFDKEDKYFVVAKREGNVAGYILFSINEDNSTIELIAVDEKYQGQKVGKSLIQTMEIYVMNQGIKKIKVGTQVNNISAARFYSAMEFKYINCGSTYHLWLK